MRRHREQRPQLIGALFGALALITPAASQDGAVNDWATFRARLAGCWQAPAGSEGSLIAFRFGLDKTGAMRGKPLVTARQLTGDAQTRRLYEEAAARALETCLPVPVTPGFGAILGESPIRLRFVNTRPTAAYQLNSNITIFAPE
jgi:hypothetical protein